MPDFAKVLAVGILLLVGLFLVFSNTSTPEDISHSYYSYITPEDTESKELVINEIEELIPIVPPDLEHIEIADKITVSFNAYERTVFKENDVTVKNGFGGHKTYKKTFDLSPKDLEVLKLYISPKDSNYYGKIQIYFNGEKLYEGFLQEEKEFLLSPAKLKDTNEILVTCESSSWRLWAPTTYIFDIKLNASYFSSKEAKIPFIIRKNVNDIDTLRLVWNVEKGKGSLIAKINGHVIYKGSEKSPLVDVKPEEVELKANKENYLEFLTEKGGEFEIRNIDLILYYKSKPKVSTEFKIEKELTEINKITFNFTVAKIEGNVTSIKLNVTNPEGSSHIILLQGIIMEGKEMSIEIPKGYVSKGTNKITIVWEGNGELFVKDMKIKVE